MPTITVQMLSGYSKSLKQRIKNTLTQTLSGILDANPDGVTVWLNEAPSENYQRGFSSPQPGAEPTESAEDIVRNFLTAMENRELSRAKTYLSDDFDMVFPGNARFSELEQLIDWAKQRYQSVSKTIHTITTSYGQDSITVTCFGELSFIFHEDQPLQNVRFCDVFELKNHKICHQEVWNDLAEIQRLQSQ